MQDQTNVEIGIILFLFESFKILLLFELFLNFDKILLLHKSQLAKLPNALVGSSLYIRLFKKFLKRISKFFNFLINISMLNKGSRFMVI